MRPRSSKSLKLQSLLFVLAVMFIAPPIYALDSDVQGNDELVMQVILPDFDDYEVVLEDGKHVFKNDGMSHLYVPGKPLLPLKKYMIALPPGALEILQLFEQTAVDRLQVRDDGDGDHEHAADRQHGRNPAQHDHRRIQEGPDRRRPPGMSGRIEPHGHNRQRHPGKYQRQPDEPHQPFQELGRQQCAAQLADASAYAIHHYGHGEPVEQHDHSEDQ